MGIIEATRALGTEIQKDERFIRFAKAILKNDSDENLQNQIGEFNTIYTQTLCQVRLCLSTTPQRQNLMQCSMMLTALLCSVLTARTLQRLNRTQPARVRVLPAAVAIDNTDTIKTTFCF